MREAILHATETALRAVDAQRFFETERGFQGRFYVMLTQVLQGMGMLSNGTILEIEYQKSARHHTGQRPDIILHIPAEHSGAAVEENNFAVWALKRRATVAQAVEDFDKLDEMFRALRYPLGIFVNVDADDPMGEHYRGPFGSRLATVAVSRREADISVQWAMPDG